MEHHLDIQIEAIEPDDLELSDALALLQAAQNLLFCDRKKNSQDKITFEIIANCTLLQIKSKQPELITNTQDRLSSLNKTRNLSLHPPKFRTAIQTFQKISRERNTEIFLYSSGLSRRHALRLDAHSEFTNTVPHWYTTETYLYGVVQKVGGTNHSTLHLETDEYGTVIVDIPKQVLDQFESRLVYKEVALQVEIEQNVEGEIKGKRAKFLAFLEHEPNLDEFIQDITADKYAPYYKNIDDSVEWVKDLRGTAS